MHPITLAWWLILLLAVYMKTQNHSPDNSSGHDGFFTTEDIREKTGDKGSEPRATSHRSCDASLDLCSRALTWPWTLVEITFIGVCSNTKGLLENV
jgi:hypothetical protein